MGIDVRITAYEGPLDLLLDLIKENKVDISDIPIAEITEQYLQYIDDMKQLNLVVAGEFLVMAATLLYIKSKMLLPDDVDEEDDVEGDPRLDLVNALLEYQTFKEAAKDLNVMQEERRQIFTRLTHQDEHEGDSSSAADDTIAGNLFELIQAFSDVLKTHAIETFHEIFEEEILIDDKIELILEAIEKKPEVYFLQLFARKSTRNELIVTFMALLELIKMKKVRIVQSAIFGEISIKRY